MTVEEFKRVLGGRIGGHVDPDGHWECHDCDANGVETKVFGRPVGLGLYVHRREAKHWQDQKKSTEKKEL